MSKDMLSLKVVAAKRPTELRKNPDCWLRYAYDVVIPAIKDGSAYSQVNGLRARVGAWALLKSDPTGVVIPDNRFKNEVSFGRSREAIMLRLRRVGKDGVIEGGAANHRSEMEQKEIPDSEFFGVLDVPEGLEKYYETIDQFLKTLPGG